jgi:precorrin-3B methylase
MFVKSGYICRPVSDRLRKVTCVDEIEVILQFWGTRVRGREETQERATQGVYGEYKLCRRSIRFRRRPKEVALVLWGDGA